MQRYYFPKEKQMVTIQGGKVLSVVRFENHPIAMWNRDVDTIQFICWR